VQISILCRLTARNLLADPHPVCRTYHCDAFSSRRQIERLAGQQLRDEVKGRDLARLHLQVTSVLRAPGKLKYLAGSESGVGAWINDVAPEAVAARLREVG
jgi:UDPglucose--hexose-1-phosphate uridylyltransferase